MDERAGLSEAAAADGAAEVLERFRSCRWYKATEGDVSEHCTHRDVLPLAGTSGFNPEAWCPDCALYKLRRGARRPAATPR